MRSPAEIRVRATAGVIDLEDGKLLYAVLQEHAVLARSAEHQVEQDGQPRGMGGISDPTGGEAMREVCTKCDGTQLRRQRVECPVCHGRRTILDMGSGEPVPCTRCEGKGEINFYDPDQPCTECDQGWQYTEAQALERQCDQFAAALDMVARTVSAMRRSAPEFARGLAQARATPRKAKGTKGERFPVQEEGAACECCGARVPKLRQGLCIAYATDPRRRHAAGHFLPSRLPGCYDKWVIAFAAEDISRKEWIAREKTKSAGIRAEAERWQERQQEAPEQAEQVKIP